jgi:hypothetical protein
LPGGHIRFNFLKNHRNGVSMFAQVNSAEQVRPFSGTYRVLSQLYGTTLFQRWGWIPFSLRYQHRSRTSDAPGGFDDSAEEIVFRGTYDLGERSRGNIDYDLSLWDRSGDDVRRQAFSVNNFSSFGDEGEKRLSTNLFFNEQISEQGAGKSKHYSLSGNTSFNWQHTDDLWTQYRLGGRWSDFGSQSLTTLNPSFFLTHQLYESLRTTVEIFGRLRDGTTGSRYEVAGIVGENYVKQIGGWGLLTVHASPRLSMAWDRPKADSAEVFDEPHELRSDQPATLVHPNVIEPIVVTHPNCGLAPDTPDHTPDHICSPFNDYETETVGGFVELRLRPNSSIPEGDEVLVTYKYELGGRSDLLNTSINAGVSLWILERVRLFGRYQTSDWKVLSGNEQDLLLNPFDRTVVGLQLTWPWFSAWAEFEDYDARFAPFRGYLARAEVFTPSTAAWRARCGVGYAFRDHLDTGSTVGRLSASFDVTKRLFRRGRLELRGRYRQVRWSGERAAANDVDTVSANAAFSWWYAKIDVRLEAGMVQILRTAEDKRAYRVDLRVRRPF